MTTPAEPQAALEQAVVLAICQRLDYLERDCARTFDARPHPRAGEVFVAVWSEGGHRAGKAQGMALDRLFGVSVTVTLRTSKLPFDRLVQARDDLERRLNAIVGLVNLDRQDFSIIRQANVLAGYRTSSGPVSGATAGFCEGLRWEDTERVQDVGGEWFHAKGTAEGLAQTARFGRARHVQSSRGAR